ncbi:GDSL family lipase [bacterium]|nr:GDSL family lipase [bacterium]
MKLNSLLWVVTFFISGCVAGRPSLPPQPADVPAKRQSYDASLLKWFDRLHESYVARAQQGNVQLVFLGDSITQGWEQQADLFNKEFGMYNAVHFGVGGDCTQHVLWRIQNGELDGIQPKVVVLMIGTNNSGIAENSPEEVAAGIKKIIEGIQLKAPQAKIILHAIFPRAREDEDAKNVAVNHLIQKLADGQRVHWLDIRRQFLTPQGELSYEIMPDLLHLSSKGYQIWADQLKTPLAELMK